MAVLPRVTALAAAIKVCTVSGISVTCAGTKNAGREDGGILSGNDIAKKKGNDPLKECSMKMADTAVPSRNGPGSSTIVGSSAKYYGNTSGSHGTVFFVDASTGKRTVR